MRAPQLIAMSLLMALGLPAQATPDVQISFAQSSAVVAPSDPLEVWMTVSVAADSESLHFDPKAAAPFLRGLDPNVVPTAANHPADSGYFTTILFGGLGLQFACKPGQFASCNDNIFQHYGFSYGPGLSSIWDANKVIDIAPGASATVLFGTFTPYGNGGAPEGIYSLASARLVLYLSGRGYEAGDDPNEFPDSAFSFEYILAGSGAAQNSAVNSFQRTVVALPVPEPSSTALLMLGLLGLVPALRRRGRSTPN